MHDTRARHARDHSLLTPDTFVRAPLPGMRNARRDNGERCDENDPAQRRFTKQRAKKMHYPIPVL